MTHPHKKHRDLRDDLRDGAIAYGAYQQGQAAKELRFQSWWLTLTDAEKDQWRWEQAEKARLAQEAAVQAQLAREARAKARGDWLIANWRKVLVGLGIVAAITVVIIAGMKIADNTPAAKAERRAEHVKEYTYGFCTSVNAAASNGQWDTFWVHVDHYDAADLAPPIDDAVRAGQGPTGTSAEGERILNVCEPYGT